MYKFNTEVLREFNPDGLQSYEKAIAEPFDNRIKAYVSSMGSAQVYVFEGTMHNIVSFIMTQPMNSVILLTDMQERVILSTTFGRFLDWVPDQKLVPILQKHLNPYLMMEKETEPIQLPVAQQADPRKIERLAWGRLAPAAFDFSEHLRRLYEKNK